ncbi:hypothetical protein SELMODRAFT_416306 [Selaginella moellendorffii]|uniref:Uncharacterized protein n=1 Tax=Selaginella moellendorffii TaxID=88036 RepID=D8RYV7_SELML|nr:hypothetical protein SELMODRAFT_416306 [Selaginella moellendorffii]
MCSFDPKLLVEIHKPHPASARVRSSKRISGLRDKVVEMKLLHRYRGTAMSAKDFGILTQCWRILGRSWKAVLLLVCHRRTSKKARFSLIASSQVLDIAKGCGEQPSIHRELPTETRRARTHPKSLLHNGLEDGWQAPLESIQ